MEKHSLKVQPRTITGKKVKQLRKGGIIPANIYGKAVNSQAVQVEKKIIEKLLSEIGETSVVEVTIEGQEKTVPVLLHNVQYHVVTREPLHVDLYQVNLKEKVKAHVPLVLVGEAKAIVDKLGVILELLNEVEVEALPTDLPENIEVNIESLAAVDEQVLVGDLKIPAGIELLTDKELPIARVGELVVKEKVEEKPVEEAVEGTAGAEGIEGTGVEGEEIEEKKEATEEKEDKKKE